jgi:hypothetical protein
MSPMTTHLQRKINRMLRVDYPVLHYICGYVTALSFVFGELTSTQSYKCIFMENGFWSPLEKKTKSAVRKINRLT